MALHDRRYILTDFEDETIASEIVCKNFLQPIA